jgi:c-di-GMP-binding flagellar brake protein YcgR
MEVERRRLPRARIAVPCTLHRRSGSPIAGRTYDLGPGGMSVSTARPLAADELLSFDLELDGQPHVDGRARVLRQQDWDRYSLRFEVLSESKRARLAGLTGSPV